MANVHILRPEKKPQQLQCSACGVVADGACDCGAPYVPVGVRAAEALAKNPEKSNRAIAKDLGVSYEAVRKARTDNQLSVESRVGLDGKTRRMPRSRGPTQTDIEEAIASLPPDEKTIEESVLDDISKPKEEVSDPNNYRVAFLLRTDMAKRAAKGCAWMVEAHKADRIPRSISKDIARAARAVATAWSALAQELEQAS